MIPLAEAAHKPIEERQTVMDEDIPLPFDLPAVPVCAAWTSPLASERQVLTFRTRAWLSFAPPTCRMPLGQSQDIPRTCPGRMTDPRFRHRLIPFRHFN